MGVRALPLPQRIGAVHDALRLVDGILARRYRVDLRAGVDALANLGKVFIKGDVELVRLAIRCIKDCADIPLHLDGDLGVESDRS